MYCPSSNADVGGYYDWKYLNNSRTAPAAGLASATVTMTAPSAAGTTCNARLFANDWSTKVATSATVTVTAPPTPTFTMGPTDVAPGGTLTISLANGPANRGDWVALYCPTSNNDVAHYDWKYLSNSRTAPAAGLASATVTMMAPSAAGTTCHARLFANDWYHETRHECDRHGHGPGPADADIDDGTR